MSEQPLDFDHYRIFAMYADGVPVADIALEFGWSSPGPVYERLNSFPKKYAEAKKHLAEKRNAKYRRVGALAVDIQTGTLEEYQARLAKEPELKAEYNKLLLESAENGYEDILESEDADIEKKKAVRIRMMKISQFKETLLNIEGIRKNLKDISTIGESAERRADLNEGKATERVINVGMEPTPEEWQEFWNKQKEAGNGLDIESIGA
jgi:hypothetical protein